MKSSRLGSLIATCLVWSLPALAGTVLPAGATWQYSFSPPTEGWQTGAGAGVVWESGPAPFGNCGLANVDCVGLDPLFAGKTLWPADQLDDFDDDLWVRRTVDLSAFDSASETLHWNLGVDNGYKLYVNGVLLSQDNAEGYTFRWEYTGIVPASMLVPGTNWIALALEDHGVVTAFDMEMSTAVPPLPVPEPSALLLWLGGLGLLTAMNCQKKWRPTTKLG